MRWSLCDHGLHSITSYTSQAVRSVFMISCVVSCVSSIIVEVCDAMEGCRVVRKACDSTFASGLASPYQTCKLASQKCQGGKIEISMQLEIQNIQAKNPIKFSNFGEEHKIVAGIAGTSRVRGRKVDGFHFYLLSDIPLDISD